MADLKICHWYDAVNNEFTKVLKRRVSEAFLVELKRNLRSDIVL